jgi:hypothetical protein
MRPRFEIRILHGDVCVGFCTESAPAQFMPGAEPSIYAYRCNDRIMPLKDTRAIMIKYLRIAPGDAVEFMLSGQFIYLLVNGLLVGTCGANFNARKVSSSSR